MAAQQRPCWPSLEAVAAAWSRVRGEPVFRESVKQHHTDGCVVLKIEWKSIKRHGSPWLLFSYSFLFANLKFKQLFFVNTKSSFFISRLSRIIYSKMLLHLFFLTFFFLIAFFQHTGWLKEGFLKQESKTLLYLKDISQWWWKNKMKMKVIFFLLFLNSHWVGELNQRQTTQKCQLFYTYTVEIVLCMPKCICHKIITRLRS